MQVDGFPREVGLERGRGVRAGGRGVGGRYVRGPGGEDAVGFEGRVRGERRRRRG